MPKIPSIWIYADESGHCRGKGLHLVAIVATADDTRTGMDASRFFQDQGISVEQFHATCLRDPTLLSKCLGQLGTEAFAAVAWHESTDPNLDDIYFPLLVEAVDSVWDAVVARHRQLHGFNPSISVAIVTEERNAYNELALAEELRARLRRVQPKRLGAAVRQPMAFPKGSDEVLQIADLVANRTFRWLRGVRRANRPGDVALTEVTTRDLTDARVLEFREGVAGRAAVMPSSDRRAECLLYWAVERVDRPWTEALEGEWLDGEPVVRAAEIDELLVRAEELAEKQRDYLAAEHLGEVLDQILELERNRSEMPSARMRRWQLAVEALHVLIANHTGHCVRDTPRVVAARTLAAATTEPEGWRLGVRFRNYLAVNALNAHDHAGAWAEINDLVDGVQRPVPGLFGDVRHRGRWVGALYGTYGQTYAFKAHDAAFALVPQGVSDALDEAEYWMECAAEEFDQVADRERQVTYRAHVQCQRAMLGLGGVPNLAELEQQSEGCVDAFVDLLPSPASSNPAYRLSVMLKTAWLSGARPTWLPKLASRLRRHQNKIPSLHPLEQILGYCALLSDGQDRRLFEEMLARTAWPGLVAFIAATFEAQIEFDEEGLVGETLRSRLREHVAALGFPPGWLSGRFSDELAVLSRKGAPAPGPLRLLPFNYA